jgi:Fe-S-cluster containining protein
VSEGCATCSGRCCHDIYVRITGFDAARIAADQRIGIRTFCNMPEEREDSGHGFLLGDGRRHDLHLAQQDEDPGACVWLMTVDADVQRCGIYASRPRVCSVYPFLISRGTLDIRSDARCKPGDWHLSSLHLRRRRYDFSTHVAESELYAEMVRVWNDAGDAERSEDRYERFVIAAIDAFSAVSGDIDKVCGRWTEGPLPAQLVEEKARLLQLAGEVARQALSSGR